MNVARAVCGRLLRSLAAVRRPGPALAGARLAVGGGAVGCGVGWRFTGLGGSGTRMTMGW